MATHVSATCRHCSAGHRALPKTELCVRQESRKDCRLDFSLQPQEINEEMATYKKPLQRLHQSSHDIQCRVHTTQHRQIDKMLYIFSVPFLQAMHVGTNFICTIFLQHFLILLLFLLSCKFLNSFYLINCNSCLLS